MRRWPPALVALGLAAAAARVSWAQQDCGASGTGDVYVGGLFDYRLTDHEHFTFAAELVNDKTDGFFDDLLPGLTLQATTRDSGCNVNQATTQAWQLAQAWGEPLHGIIGARCSSASMGVATLTRLTEVPQISARSTNPALSDTDAYSHFFRTCAPDDRQGPALQALVAGYGWSQVGIITTDLAYPIGVADEFVNGWSGTVAARCTIPLNGTGHILSNKLIGCFESITALPPLQRPRVILLSAHLVQVDQILAQAVVSEWQPDAIWLGTDSWTGMQLSNSVSYQLLGVRPAANTAADEHQDYLQRWQAAQQLAGEVPDEELCGYCAETVDAVVAMAMALTATYATGATTAESMSNIDNGTLVLPHLRSVSFDGVSGSIAFDEHGDRLSQKWEVMHIEASENMSWATSVLFDVFVPSQSAWFDGGSVPMDNYAGNCAVGSECVDSDSGAFCDTTQTGGECVDTVKKGQCAARDGDNGEFITLFDPVDVSCTNLDAGKYDCTSPASPVDSAPIENKVASLCAAYLPEVLLASDDQSTTMPMCCRANDMELNKWMEERWDQYGIQFGQCSNCLHMTKKLLCQVACDAGNYRFLTGGSTTMAFGIISGQDAGICSHFCNNVHMACRDVKWSDEIRYLHSESLSFCEEVLHLQVTPNGATWDGVEASTDSQRLCTPGSAADDIHCVGAGAHGALGVVSTLLCVFTIVAELLAERVTTMWVPGATVILCTGFLLGVFIKEVLAPFEDSHSGTHLFTDLVEFNTDIFGFLLLPVIIFSSSFNMEHHASVFFHLYIQRISLFAVLGTLIAISFTGGLIYLICHGMLSHEMSFPDAMMFGSLISAVDPVATLTAFASVGVDPRVYSMIYGESILNDAVAIVLFSVFKEVAGSENPFSSSYLAFTVSKNIVVLSVGSLMCGLIWGVLVTLLYKVYGVNPPPGNDEARREETSLFHSDEEKIERTKIEKTVCENPVGGGDVETEAADAEAGEEGNHGDEKEHRRHKAMADASVFFIASISSYYVAEALHFSGIISALICGIICNQFTVWNMSFEAREYARAFYIVLSEISDHLLMMWVGLLYYFSLEHFNVQFSLVALVLVVSSRALSVFSCGAIVGCTGDKLPMSTQIMMFGAGLRGAVALALVMQMPTSSAEEVASATLFVVFWTNIVLGGLTTPMVLWLKIPNEGNGTLDVSTFEFTEKEKKWLQRIDKVEERWAQRLLVNGTKTVKTLGNNAKGKSESKWHAKFHHHKRTTSVQQVAKELTTSVNSLADDQSSE
jgi:NhaP-type Na+/H+ or K+/H+ antiporter/ABC-type branched-subunit amino acid transport system substrate-binding protein